MRPVASSANIRLQAAFCAAVISLAIFQFSENTVDPDLWGHVVFGQHMLQTGSIPRADLYSWTASGQPWINHEWLAEIVLGKAHQLGGGGALLLLKLIIGLAAFGICMRLGARSLAGPMKLFAWAFAAVAVVEISFGFAARPQIFTALFLALELVLLQQIHAGRWRWMPALPLLFLAWINFHGGALAGIGLLGLMAGITTLEKFRNEATPGPSSAKTIILLWLTVALSIAALLVNPWKTDLLRWLVGSVLWSRPEIAEWNPTRLTWDHAAFFIILIATIFSWLFTQRRRIWWELAACIAFAGLGWRAERNAPLFCLVALAFVPPHLASATQRFKESLANLEHMGRQRSFQAAATMIFALAAAGIPVATLTLHKEHPLTMESPRDQYPVAAISFIREHHLQGKMLTFFDWGEMVIFELPDCPVSIDGRLDTSYSRDLIATHWRFYNDEPFDEKLLPVDNADLALLPSHLAGAAGLSRRIGWKIIYQDPLAMVLARGPERFPSLKDIVIPAIESQTATTGREPFPPAQ